MADASAGFRRAVLEVVSRIPEGRVTTYGRIAAAIGHPRRARHVGMALANATEAGDYPCHRVVNRDGFLSGGWAFGHPDAMRQLLEEEGVPFVAEHTVDLDACLWEPPDRVSARDAQGLDVDTESGGIADHPGGDTDPRRCDPELIREASEPNRPPGEAPPPPHADRTRQGSPR